MSERLPTFKTQPPLGPADGDAAGRRSPQTEGGGGESTVEVVPATDAAAKDGLHKNDGSHSGDHPPSQTPFAEVSGETVHLAGLGCSERQSINSFRTRFKQVRVDLVIRELS